MRFSEAQQSSDGSSVVERADPPVYSEDNGIHSKVQALGI